MLAHLSIFILICYHFIKPYIKPNFGYTEIEEIYEGLESNVDVSNYANSVFFQEQMKIIRKGLEKKLNVELLKNPKLTIKEIKIILACSELGWNVVFKENNDKTIIIEN